MPTIHRLTNRKARICMFPDHAPPHFHLIGPGWAAVIEIGGLALVRGDAPRAELAEAREWATRNAEHLRRCWEELNERDG